MMAGAVALAASLLGAVAPAGAHRAVGARAAISYAFTSIANPNDPTFTQLLGINKAGAIAGYYGSGADAQHPNQGFVLGLPAAFTPENYPNSAQTQVIGINNHGDTAGFYVDRAGATHGFTDYKGAFATVAMPGTTFNQLLGLNNSGDQAGYYQTGPNDHPTFFPYIHRANGTFRRLPIANAQATGLNDHGLVVGFANDAAGHSHGFLWHAGAKPKTVGYLTAVSTQLLGVNNLGWAVGSCTDVHKVTHGVVYNANTQTYTQVDVPMATSTVINGINRLGWLAGFYTDASNHTIGFVAKPGRGPGMPGIGPAMGTASTLTSLSANVNPSVQASPVTITVQVSPSTATGTVQLTDTYTNAQGTRFPATPLATGQLSNGTFTFQTSQLVGGRHAITAMYSGDNKDAASFATLLHGVAQHF
jgi:probable HAF family extracellular repeat protein